MKSKLNNLDSTIKDTESGYKKLVLAGENLMSIVSQSVSDIDKKLLENSTSNTRNSASNTRNNTSVSYKINSVSFLIALQFWPLHCGNLKYCLNF